MTISEITCKRDGIWVQFLLGENEGNSGAIPTDPSAYQAKKKYYLRYGI